MRRAIQNESEGPTTTDPADVGDTATGHKMGRIRARRRGIIVAVVLGALVLGGAYLVSKPGSDTPAANGAGAGPNYAEIESFVQGEMAAQRVPGLALGIVEHGRIAYVRGFGKADDSGCGDGGGRRTRSTAAHHEAPPAGRAGMAGRDPPTLRGRSRHRGDRCAAGVRYDVVLAIVRQT